MLSDLEFSDVDQEVDLETDEEDDEEVDNINNEPVNEGEETVEPMGK